MGIDVIGIGAPCVDLLLNIDHLPANDESIPIEEYSYQGGGKVATALVTLARLGNETGIIGEIGNDRFGEFIERDFQEHGVDTNHLNIQKSGKTPFSVVLSDLRSNSRNILYNKGELNSPEYKNEDIEYVKQAKFLHLAYPRNYEYEIVKKLTKENISIVFDADFYEPEIKKFFPHIDVLIASQEFADVYQANNYPNIKKYKELILKIADKGIETVIITLGKEGSLVYHNEEIFHQESFSVKVQDTTGAGDVYHGAFIHGLLHKMSIKKTAKVASAVAAMKSTVIGGRAGIPTVSDLKEFLNNDSLDITDREKRIKKYKDEFHR